MDSSTVRPRIEHNNMTTATTTGSHCRRHRRRGRWLTSLTAIMVAHQITPADCFGTSAVVTDSRERAASSLTKFHFRSDGVSSSTTLPPPTTSATTASPGSPSGTTSPLFYDDSWFAASDILLSSSASSTQMKKPSPPRHLEKLPTWLAKDQSHLYETNLQRLHDEMKKSFFTETERLRLSKVIIEEAASGNRHLAAAAADFCLLLLETMDMGWNALAAAAFHFCSCVRFRQSGGLGSFPHHQPSSSSSSSVDRIATDAARLKQLEMVAGSVFDKNAEQTGTNPDRRDAENLRHLLLTETKDWRALAIRSAACLYRLRGIQKSSSQQQNRLTKESVTVAREALSIYAYLASRLGMHRLKNELEEAAFSILYRRQYDAVKQLDDPIGESMRQVLDHVKLEMDDMLQNDYEFRDQVESFEVTARVKEPYSMWKKMLRMGYKHILQVPDALALRIVLKAKKQNPEEPDAVTRARERALCYYAQQLCQERWQPVEGDPRFKDYIANPKSNGYQSLHYTAQTVWQGDPWTMEVQVRSAEMHQVAEFGLASHWDYKDTQQQDVKVSISSSPAADTDQSSAAYLRHVQEFYWKQQHGTPSLDDASPAPGVILSDIWQSRERADRIRARNERLEPYLQALNMAQNDLAREHVYVFLKTCEDDDDSFGKVLALPSGACVLDGLREGERTLGVNAPAALVNGQDTSVTKRLHNGDILELCTAMTTSTM